MDQAAELGKLTGMHAVFGKAMDYSGGGYGEAVLSRWEILETRNHALPHSPDREPRCALAVRVRVGGDGPELIFAGTHLDHLRDPTDRLAQAGGINEVLGGSDGPPVILAGDMNARSGSAPMTLLLERFTDACADDPQPTYPSRGPRARIDWILFRPAGQFKVIETRVIDAPVASDHAPLLVVFEWTP